MLASTPVIATPVGSVPEAIRDEQTGLLVAVGDPEGLAAAIRRLLTTAGWGIGSPPQRESTRSPTTPPRPWPAPTRPSTPRSSARISASRARSSVGERSLHTREVAGSKPAAPIGREYGSIDDAPTVEANGVVLGVEHFGDAAAPLVLLAGGTTMLSWPDALCEAPARAGRHVVRYDLRDSGASTTVDPEAPAYTLRDLAADAAALARELDDRPATGGHRRRRDGRPGRRARPPGRVLGAHPRRDAARRTGPGRRRPARPRRGDDGPAFSSPMPDRSDRAAVASSPRRRRDPRRRPRRGPRDRRTHLGPHAGQEPAVQMANQMRMVSPSSTASRAGVSVSPSSRSRRWWCTVAGTSSSRSATARRSPARSPGAVAVLERTATAIPDAAAARSPRRGSI